MSETDYKVTTKKDEKKVILVLQMPIFYYYLKINKLIYAKEAPANKNRGFQIILIFILLKQFYTNVAFRIFLDVENKRVYVGG